MSLISVHECFQLNGKVCDLNLARQIAHDFIENGKPYEEEVGHFLLSWLDEKPYILVNTSGSTGSPKTIKIDKNHMLNSARATGKRFKLKENTTALLCLPSRYIGGKMMLVRAMVLGWKIDLVPPKSNPIDQVFKRYDFCAMTPFQLDNSIGRLHLLSKLIVGGGPFSQALKNKVQTAETKIYETYGMTETVSHVAIRWVNPKKKIEGTIPFKALNKVSVDQDKRGCLIIKAPKVSTDPVFTNDIVELVSYKKFYLLGRLDNVINSGGIKLFPEKIEAKLSAQTDIPFFVAGIPDDALGERVVLIVESEPNNEISFDFSVLDKYEVPKSIYYLPVFERTENGKLKRSFTLKKLEKGV